MFHDVTSNAIIVLQVTVLSLFYIINTNLEIHQKAMPGPVVMHSMICLPVN